jgi:hypothetical protein
VRRGARATLTITLTGAKLGPKSATVSGQRRELTKVTAPKSGTSYWALTLQLPAGVTAVKATAPRNAGAGGAPIISATEVNWPRVPLKEAAKNAQKLTLRVSVQLSSSIPADIRTLNFRATAKSGPYLFQANPTPLQVRKHRKRVACWGDG